mgnify:FL=1
MCSWGCFLVHYCQSIFSYSCYIYSFPLSFILSSLVSLVVSRKAVLATFMFLCLKPWTPPAQISLFVFCLNDVLLLEDKLYLSFFWIEVAGSIFLCRVTVTPNFVL